MSTLKEKIKNANDRKSEEMTIEEWDVTLAIKAFSARKRMDMPKLAKNAQDNEEWFDFVVYLLKESCFDPETGEAVFEDGDKEWIGEKSGPILDRIIQKCMEVNGISEKAVKDAEKN